MRARSDASGELVVAGHRQRGGLGSLRPTRQACRSAGRLWRRSGCGRGGRPARWLPGCGQRPRSPGRVGGTGSPAVWRPVAGRRRWLPGLRPARARACSGAPSARPVRLLSLRSRRSATEHLADPGEHRAQRMRRGLLQAIGDLRDAHVHPLFLRCARGAGHSGPAACGISRPAVTWSSADCGAAQDAQQRGLLSQRGGFSGTAAGRMHQLAGSAGPGGSRRPRTMTSRSRGGTGSRRAARCLRPCRAWRSRAGVTYHGDHVRAEPTCPARQAPRLLRRGRPGSADRRAGAGALRRARLRTQADRAQHARRPLAGGARRDLRGGDRGGPRGRGRGVLRARRRAAGARGRQRPRAAHHRRDLPAGHQGAQRGQALRRAGLRHPADRPRGPRGGRRHHRRGAGPDSPGRRPGGQRRGSRSATRRKVAWLSQTTLSVDETNADGGARCGSGSRSCSTRRATTSATRPRTGRPR